MLNTRVVHEEEVPGVGGGYVKAFDNIFDRFEGSIDERLAL